MILEKFKSLAWADFFLYALIDPRSLYRRIKQKDPDALWLSFAVPAAVSLADILVLSLMGKESNFFYYKISYGWILVFLFSFLRILIYASLVDAAAQFSGLRGNIREMITVINFSLLPELFILPAVYPFIVGGIIPAFFYIILTMVCFVWHVLILVQAISEMHTIEFGRSFLIFIMPAIVTGTIFFLIAVMMIINTAGYIFSIL